MRSVSAQVDAGAALQRGGGSARVSRGGSASVGGSYKVSFASANETEPDWPMSPWQQAISTSLSATLAATVVCLLGQWAPNMRRLGFHHTLPPSPPRICSSIDCDSLPFCLRPLLEWLEKPLLFGDERNAEGKTNSTEPLSSNQER
ncbi:hypothetical protein EYF80_000446 [Liparis tanakae]|uniref:Uncharacterized protein n=1 Tax=Liparis tanakae TaxID=230148 RepID=A0A4Z2JHP2_9TELE|nr:hypothetical protein EYF80_000446 [Liparis tanakae]